MTHELTSRGHVCTGDINVDPDGVWTTGLNTCIFLCIETSNGYIGWHFSSENADGLNMRRVHAILSTITGVKHAYIVPGVDRNEDMSLKATSRTMRLKPHIDPYKSRDFFLGVLRHYSLLDVARQSTGLNHYKQFVFFGKEYRAPAFGRDDAAFDSGCVRDGEKQV
jgi:hypothetical protein